MCVDYERGPIITILFEHFAKFDIVCFTEVKINETDEIVFPVYTAFKQPRKQSFIRRSGGITAYVKYNLAKYVTELNTKSDYILWLSLDKKLSRCEENYILGVAYTFHPKALISIMTMRQCNLNLK